MTIVISYRLHSLKEFLLVIKNPTKISARKRKKGKKYFLITPV